MKIARTTLLVSASAAALVIGGIGASLAQEQQANEHRDAAQGRAEAAQMWGTPAYMGRAAEMLRTLTGNNLPEGGLILHEQNSVGRGWDYPVYVNNVDQIADPQLPDATPPEGVTALERDVFTTDNFWLDEALWMDPHYWRCNTPRMMTDLRSGGPGVGTPDPRAGRNPPESARWGTCNDDYPMVNIISPYPFESAAEHYNALLEETRANGGPTVYTWEDPPPPEWNGRYADRAGTWNQHGRAAQTPTILALLNDEFRARMVQQLYHEGVSAAHQWPAAYCWPEGLMREWATGPRANTFILNPEVVLRIGSSTMNTRRMHWVGVESHADLGPEFPQWLGDSISFWDGDVFITWTANVQGWTQHTMWEWSNDLETIDIFSPIYGAGGAFWGLLQEQIVYDNGPRGGMLEPVRLVREIRRANDLNSARQLFIECVPTFFPDANSYQNPVAPGQTVNFTFRSIFDRPWAQIWEEVFEQNMPRPGREGAADGGLDLGIFAGR